jgi:anti-sigma B factor antagonist
MPAQPFDISVVAGLPVVAAPEEIDIRNAAELRSALLTAAAQSPVVVVDLSGTEFCDSSGLNVLVRALRRAQADGGEVRLVATRPAVLRILSVTGVGSLFSVHASLDEALTSEVGDPGTSPVSVQR